MNLRLKKVAPLQAGKMLAAFYGLLSLVMVPIFLGFMAVAGVAARTHGGSSAPLPLMFGMGIGFVLFLPLVYAAMGFIFGVIGAFIYNLLAGWLGGFELQFEELAPPPVR